MALKKWYFYMDVIFGILTMAVIFTLFLLSSVLTDVVDAKRLGFFCDDNSIRYPYLPRSSVPAWSLYIIVLGAPLFVMICGVSLEILQKKCKKRFLSTANASHEHLINYKQILLKSCIWYCWYLIGLGLTDIITNIIKMSTGELRPHFLAVCNPDWSLFNCTDEQGHSVYVTNYTCRGPAGLVREARLSFPSGHASSIFFSMVFTAFYISSVKIVHKRSPAQFFFLAMYGILFPSLVGMTRIDDHYHHFHDVIFGGLLGGFLAIVVVFFHLHYFGYGNEKKLKSESESDEYESELEEDRAIKDDERD